MSKRPEQEGGTRAAFAPLERKGPPVSFSALILAGGRSSRMGRDKAWLEVEGQPLIRRQLALVQQLHPETVWISGPPTKALQGLGVPVIPDSFSGQGPLAGIERGLAVMNTDLLLVLAVDMPRMAPAVLQRLLAHATQESGVIPVVQDHLEPLAALYPKCAAASARAFLEGGCNSATQFAEWTVHLGLARLLTMPESAWPCFVNWNFPEDVGRP